MEKKVAVDVNTISNFIVGGRIIQAREILELYEKKGVLVYDSSKGVPPIVIEGEINVLDYQTEEGKAFLENHKK